MPARFPTRWTEFVLCGAVCVVASPAAADTHAPITDVVTFSTPLGDIHVGLYGTVAPATVANFLNYVDDGDYNNPNTFFHRSPANFVIQGGGFTNAAGAGEPVSIGDVPTDDPVVNEFNVSNVRGTIAMAKLEGDPNSATSQWFFNLGDNSANLDTQNGGFTAFGEVLSEADLAVIDAIAAVPTFNYASPYGEIPLLDFTQDDFLANEAVLSENLIDISIARDDTPDLLGDVNLDGAVDLDDINTLGSRLGDSIASAVYGNLDGDEGIDQGDLAVLFESVFATAIGDLDLDGDIDAADFIDSFAPNFGPASSGYQDGDFDFDGDVDGLDFNTFALNFGFDRVEAGLAPITVFGQLQSSSSLEALSASATAVPEPASAAALALGGLVLARRRRSAAMC